MGLEQNHPKLDKKQSALPITKQKALANANKDEENPNGRC
jgi:hypothetical protein